MDVLITGGAGFIGANLVARLQSAPFVDHIRVLDNLSTGSLGNLDGHDVEFIQGDILDSRALLEATRHVDAIVHLAAVPSVPRSIEDPLRSHESNATGTLRVLEVARSAPNASYVIVASSSSVYGANPVLPKSERLVCEPMSPYAVSKLAGEQYAMAFANCYGLRVLPFRFFNVFGPLQAAGHAYAAVVPTWIDAAINDRPLPLNGDGTQSRDFTFVDTVTSVIADALARCVSSSPLNLAFGTRTSLNVLAGMLEEVVGRPLQVLRQPLRAADVPHSQASSAALRELFPDVVPVGLREGLEKTVAWMTLTQQSGPSDR